MSCHRVANTGTYPTAYCYLHLSSNKHRSMWLNTSMRLLSLITLLIYPPSHELHMLIVWQYPKHKETLQRTRKSAIAEPPCNKEKKNDNKVIAVISLNKTGKMKLSHVIGIYWSHDDVIKWKHFPRHWPFVRGIHRSPMNSPHKGQWRGALMFCLICAWINSWVNNCEAGDLRRYLAHCVSL